MKQKIVLTKLKVDSLQTLVESRKNHQIKIGRSQAQWIQKRDTHNNIWDAKEWRVWIDAAEMRIH